VHAIKISERRLIAAGGVFFRLKKMMFGCKAVNITDRYPPAILSNVIHAADSCIDFVLTQQLSGIKDANELCLLGARSESRTRTPLPAVDFESTASTNSAIRAVWLEHSIYP
jgi:hypothetical protein